MYPAAKPRRPTKEAEIPSQPLRDDQVRRVESGRSRLGSQAFLSSMHPDWRQQSSIRGNRRVRRLAE